VPIPGVAAGKLPNKVWENIETLRSYREKPDESFWEQFPKKKIPGKVQSKVVTSELNALLHKYRSRLTVHQMKRGTRIYMDLKYGASAYQKGPLPAVRCEHSELAYKYGEQLTDKIATWIKDGFLVGPLEEKPTPDFRCNKLLVVERNDKIRPIIDLSHPKGNSFNRNVEEKKLEKVRMATARDFGVALQRAGRGATFSKFDIKDAYKLIPAKKSDWNLQGFVWLEKYFFESQMIFGGKPSVCNFDRLAKTLVDITLAETELSAASVCRTLDDIPVVSPAGSGDTEKFSEAFRRICSKIGVPLAENDPKLEKAFENSTRGVVLGVGFDSTDMTWYLTEEKADKVVLRCKDAVGAQMMNLKQVQKIMGTINDISLVMPFMKPYRYAGNCFLAQFQSNEDIWLPVPDQMKKDLIVCMKIVHSARSGLPLCKHQPYPSLGTLVFHSDAAGLSITHIQSQKIEYVASDGRGVASVGGYSEGNPSWWSYLGWPSAFLLAYDEEGARFGSKTSTLEAVGLLLPFITIPEELVGKNICFVTDNIAVTYGWENGGIKFDRAATVILRAIHVMSAYLGARVFVNFAPRNSTRMLTLVDSLSRIATTSERDLKFLASARRIEPAGAILEWLRNPTSDFVLA
jgi:hypothetical protein